VENTEVITRRPSGFDRKDHFAPPNEDERRAYCRYWRQKFVDEDGVDFPEEVCHAVAKLTERFSFAYMKELFVSSLILLIGGGAEGVEEPTSEKVADSENSTEKSTLPSFQIPQHVQDTVLFRTIKLQAQALLEDLDSTPSDTVKQPNAVHPPPPRFSLPSLIDEFKG
jgi:transitional endoplasmic reticulum ATPase